MYEQTVTFLFVSDLTRSFEFYAERIGLQPVLEQPGCRILRIAGEAFLGLCEREPSPAGVILTFVPRDLEETYARLSAAGVPCDGPPRYNERYDIIQFFANDPDGYTLEFQRFCSPAWPAV